jgi:uncharacterized lipoprotein
MIRNLKPVATILLLFALLAMLVGCAGRDRQPVYAGSEEIDPIEAPPGLDQPQPRTTYEVPGYYLPELAAQGSVRPPRVQPSIEAERSRSHIRFGPHGLFLEVQDEADSVWRRLGFTLNRSGMQVREIDESVRRYRFHFSHDPIEVRRTGLSRLAVWRGSEIIDYSGDYRIEVREREEEVTDVILLDARGDILEMDRAEFVLARLRDRLG